LDKYRDIEIQYKILSKLFNIDNKLEILEYIYKSAEYIKLFENKRFKLYPLIFPNISVNFIGYYIWDFIFEFDQINTEKYYNNNYIKTKNSNKNELYELFNKLDELLFINLDDINNKKYKINFPYFENNIYITIKNINDNDYYNIIEIIDKKRSLNDDDNDAVYVLIIDHNINNSSELDKLCEENEIIPIYII